MITVQWCDRDEIAFRGLEFEDDQYGDALKDYHGRKGVWDLVRMILATENEHDWIVLHSHDTEVGG